jgi:hypothetical protein
MSAIQHPSGCMHHPESRAKKGIGGQERDYLLWSTLQIDYHVESCRRYLRRTGVVHCLRGKDLPIASHLLLQLKPEREKKRDGIGTITEQLESIYLSIIYFSPIHVLVLFFHCTAHAFTHTHCQWARHWQRLMTMT